MRTRFAAILLCALTFSEAAAQQPPPPPELTCESLEQCLALLQKPYPCMPDCPGGDPLDYGFIHDQGGYFSLPPQFEKFGRPGVLALLELLKQPNLSIRARAGMVLSVSSALTPADLPAILQESRNGNEWIVAALARIRTPEALSELVSLLRKSSDIQSPPGWALKSLGNEATPLLLETLACKTEQACSIGFVRAIGELASEPGIRSDQILDRLIDIAITREQFVDARVGALQALARLKPNEETDRSTIRALLNDPDAKVRIETKATLVAWPDEMAPMLEPSDCAAHYTQYDNSMNIVSEGCQTYAESSPSVLKKARLRNIGRLGPIGQKRSSYVLELLRDEDWDVRANAAKTLGLTGETDAIPYLIDAISARDWKLTLEAMTSLKKLKAGEADKIFENIAKTYWHPAIADTARALLKGQTAPPQPGNAYRNLLGNTLLDFCQARADQSLLPKCSPQSDTREEIDRFNQERENYRQRFTQAFLDNSVLKDAVPLGATLKAEEGEFIGTDNGEFGGELVFANGATRQTILKENIVAVTRQGDRIIVITGLSHMITDEGYILEIKRRSDRSWEAKRLWRLPGAPSLVVMAPDGTIGLHGHFDSVLYSPNDTLHWLACGPSYSCRQ